MATRIWVARTGDWSTAADWSPQGVPGLSDTAWLGAGANVTIAQGESEAVRYVSLTDPTASLTVGGSLQDATVQLSGGQFRTSGGFQNVTLTSTLATSTFTVEGSLFVDSAAPGQPGLVVTAAGVTVVGTGQGALDIGPLLRNDGTALVGSPDPSNPVVVQNLIVSGQVDVAGAVVLKSASAQGLVNVAPGGDLVLQNADVNTVRIVSGTVDDSMGNSSPQLADVDVTFDDAAGKLVVGESNRPTITGFRAGDTIDVKGVSVSGPLSPNSSGALQVGGAVITLQGPTAPGAAYAAASDGSGGTLVTATAEPAATVAFSDATTGAKGSHALVAASGGPSYLQWEYVEPQSLQYIGDADTVAMTATVPNVFLKGGTGSKALAVASGQNVLDGGSGSAFLSGGSGTDTFFVDIRGGNSTWDTLANFHAGDAVTIWGWVPGVSTETFDAQAGAAGYQGATLRLANGEGGPPSSVTFVGLSADRAAHLQMATGTVGARSYLYLYNPGV